MCDLSAVTETLCSYFIRGEGRLEGQGQKQWQLWKWQADKKHSATHVVSASSTTRREQLLPAALTQPLSERSDRAKPEENQEFEFRHVLFLNNNNKDSSHLSPHHPHTEKVAQTKLELQRK